MKDSQTWIIPIHLKSEANIREYWRKTYERNKRYKKRIEIAFLCDKIDVAKPLVLKLIRIAPRPLDEDNLLYAFKSIRDYICDKLIPGLRPGQADSSNLIKIKYGQEKGKYAVKIVMHRMDLLREPNKSSMHDLLMSCDYSAFCAADKNKINQVLEYFLCDTE